MKLDAFALRNAVANKDIKTILDLFAVHFEDIARRKDEQWQIKICPWEPLGMLRLRTSSGSSCWNGLDYFNDSKLYSRNGINLIMFAPDFCSETCSIVTGTTR
jgi:hypothetical protein